MANSHWCRNLKIPRNPIEIYTAITKNNSEEFQNSFTTFPTIITPYIYYYRKISNHFPLVAQTTLPLFILTVLTASK
jgi:hypothetical protein